MESELSAADPKAGFDGKRVRRREQVKQLGTFVAVQDSHGEVAAQKGGWSSKSGRVVANAGDASTWTTSAGEGQRTVGKDGPGSGTAPRIRDLALRRGYDLTSFPTPLLEGLQATSPVTPEAISSQTLYFRQSSRLRGARGVLGDAWPAAKSALPSRMLDVNIIITPYFPMFPEAHLPTAARRYRPANGVSLEISTLASPDLDLWGRPALY